MTTNGKRTSHHCAPLSRRLANTQKNRTREPPTSLLSAAPSCAPFPLRQPIVKHADSAARLRERYAVIVVDKHVTRRALATANRVAVV